MPEKELLRKYFEGRCTAEELSLILQWLEDGRDDLAPLREMMADHWQHANESEGGETLKPLLLAMLRSQLYEADIPGNFMKQTSEQPKKIGSRKYFLRYAAAAVLTGVLFVGYKFFDQYRLKEQAGRWRSLTNVSTRIKYCTLPDSTKVWLNPKSTLSWRMPLDEGEIRSVRIEGEAFFDIARQKDHPFVAYSGPLATQVLGTAFNVEAYPDEKDVRISLVSGKVAIRLIPVGSREEEQVRDSFRNREFSNSDSIHLQDVPNPDSTKMSAAPVAVWKMGIAQVLKAGETLTYVRETSAIRKAPLKMMGMDDWTTGHLVFSEVPVKVALERLSRLYHFSLRYDKNVSLDNDRFSTVFTKEETPAQMIKNILFITHYTYRISGNEVLILHK